MRTAKQSFRRDNASTFSSTVPFPFVFFISVHVYLFYSFVSLNSPDNCSRTHRAEISNSIYSSLKTAESGEVARDSRCGCPGAGGARCLGGEHSLMHIAPVKPCSLTALLNFSFTQDARCETNQSGRRAPGRPLSSSGPAVSARTPLSARSFASSVRPSVARSAPTRSHE